MPKFNCPEVVKCPPTESPVTNYSSEREDRIGFLGSGFIPDGPDNGNGPFLNDTWFALGCKGWCSSTISQEAANLCAQAQVQECVNSGDPTGPTGPGNPGGGPDGFPVDDGGGSGGSPDYTPPHNPDNPHSNIGNDPQTCTLTCPSGSTMSYTIPAGSVMRSSRDLANAAAMSIACTQAQANLFCLQCADAWACVNDPVSSEPIVEVTGIGGIFTLKVVGGTVPPGLELFQDTFTTAIFIGTPNTPGHYSFIVQATNQGGQTGLVTCHFDILGLTNPNLPDGSVGTAYSQQLNVAGADGPFTFSILDGALPTGLSLSSSGLVSGTPTVAGSFQMTVQYFNAAFQSCRQTVTIRTVLSVCFDWSTLPWGLANTITNGLATASFTPSNTSGANFDFFVKAPNTGAGDNGGTQNDAGSTVNPAFEYNGPGCNCKLTYTATVLDLAIAQSLLFTIDYSPDGGFSWFNLVFAPAVFNAPDVILFSLPDTLGSPIMIRVQAAAQIPNLGPPFGHQEIEMIGTISTV